MSKPIRVLFVDDSDDDVMLLIKALKKGGYSPIYEQVDTADAMSDALDSQTWDAILCDYSMPNFSAFSALKLYKKKGFDLPFIIVSGTITDATAVSAMKAGAHDYIIKDNDIALKKVVNKIEKIARLVELQRGNRIVKQAMIVSVLFLVLIVIFSMLHILFNAFGISK